MTQCPYCDHPRDFVHEKGLSRHILMNHPEVVEDALAGAKGYSDTRFTGGASA